jgi:hypothetical protein
MGEQQRRTPPLLCEPFVVLWTVVWDREQVSCSVRIAGWPDAVSIGMQGRQKTRASGRGRGCSSPALAGRNDVQSSAIPQPPRFTPLQPWHTRWPVVLGRVD